MTFNNELDFYYYSSQTYRSAWTHYPEADPTSLIRSGLSRKTWSMSIFYFHSKIFPSEHTIYQIQCSDCS